MDAPAKVRVPPHSKEAEMMVLGCMLTSINSLNIAAERLEESDFYFSEHKIIFRCLQDAYKADRPADIHLVAEELKRQDTLQAVGGIVYLTSLAQYAGTSAYIEEYTEVVKNKSVLRQMVSSAQHVEKHALEEPQDVDCALDEAQQLFFRIGQTRNPQAGVQVRDILSGRESETALPFIKELEARQERYMRLGSNDVGITGIPTNFVDLDRMINGLGNSHLVIVASRPAMGKTALALNIAENVSFKNNIPVGIFSLEMTAEQLVHRIVCSQSEVESTRIRTGSLTPMEFHQVVESVNEIQQHTIVIDDQPGLKITDLRARARRMKESHKVGLIIIDYLQLISGSGSAKTIENRQNEISEISRMLKILAREIDIPIVCLSQLSRRVEERTGHRPIMSDLRESGCLTGDTRIRDAMSGKVYTIQELANRPKQDPMFVHSMGADLKVGAHAMVKAFYSGKKTVYELKTRSGRTIKASGNHPFLRIDGWIPLEKLRIGEKLAIPRKMEFEKVRSPMADDELILLAHLLGDGCILERQPYHYTSADKENIETVCQTAEKLFQIKPRIEKQKNWFHAYLPCPYKLTHGKHHPISNWFQRLGLTRAHSYEKEIPLCLSECSLQQISLFLRHLWATDGNISRKMLRGRKPAAAIYYASSSKNLGEQVQHLLLRLGIQSTITTVRSSKGYRNMYHVLVQGTTNQKLFLKHVGCAGERGKSIPALLKDLEKIEENPNLDVIPKEAWKTIIAAAKEKSGLSWRAIQERLGMSYCGSSLFKSGISRKRLQLIEAILPAAELRNLANSDLYWDEIVSITELGEEDVYDLTVKDTHNFVANDIIVHNSIEQDADVVIFLLRREYYDPYDRPGQAELIVAKNRHGGIGNITLTYRKEIAQFANFSQSSQGGENGYSGDGRNEAREPDFAAEPM
jgi:replicative DNA helicase